MTNEKREMTNRHHESPRSQRKSRLGCGDGLAEHGFALRQRSWRSQLVSGPRPDCRSASGSHSHSVHGRGYHVGPPFALWCGYPKDHGGLNLKTGECMISPFDWPRLAAMLVAVSAAIGLSELSQAEDSWPEYRGPTQDGHADANPPLKWSEADHVLFATPIHGRGWSTPVVEGSQIWLTTATEDGKQMSVICLDRKTGEILHDEIQFRVAEPRPLGNDVNSYATPSPVIEPGRVFVHFGSYGTACLDTTTMQTVWSRDDLPCNHFRGPALIPRPFRESAVDHHGWLRSSLCRSARQGFR